MSTWSAATSRCEKFSRRPSAYFVEALPPARNLDGGQHVIVALGRDGQRLAGIEQIEELLFQRVPLGFVELGILAGVTEIRLLEELGVRRGLLVTAIDRAGKVHRRFFVGDGDGCFLAVFLGGAWIDRPHIEMRAA